MTEVEALPRATPLSKPLLQPLHTISVVDTEAACLKAIEQILSDCSEWHIVGLYCEWKHKRLTGAPGCKNGKVLIISICTYKGYRMDKLDAAPKCLKDLLESSSVGKVGVGTAIVAKYLSIDYGIRLTRFSSLEEFLIKNKSLLNPLSKQIHAMCVDRDENDFDHRKWTYGKKLSKECTTLAAKHVYACIEIQNQLDPDFFLTHLSSLGF